jgi:hypothetical protein
VRNLDGTAFCQRCDWTGVLPGPVRGPVPAPDSPMVRSGRPSPQRLHSVPATRPGGWG